MTPSLSPDTSAALYLGLMSGTSADGVDLAVTAICDDRPTLLASFTKPYPQPLRQRILELYEPRENEIDQMGVLDLDLAEFYAEAVMDCLAKHRIPADRIVALGCHGQTVRHRTERSHRRTFSLQLGCPSTLAQRTKLTTVAKFRQKDIASGGQGAPLAPGFHRAVFFDPKERRAVVNIGGIANATLLIPETATVGFDTGPGNSLMDIWAELARGVNYDDRGLWGATGRPVPALLAALLSHPYFAVPPPKSTGREEFCRKWLLATVAPFADEPKENIQATLRELTVQSIVNALPALDRVFICGGGAHNDALMKRLGELLAPTEVTTTAALGVAPDWVEAMAFAWLAYQTLSGLPGNLPSVTGASQPEILGGIYPA